MLEWGPAREDHHRAGAVAAYLLQQAIAVVGAYPQLGGYLLAPDALRQQPLEERARRAA